MIQTYKKFGKHCSCYNKLPDTIHYDGDTDGDVTNCHNKQSLGIHNEYTSIITVNIVVNNVVFVTTISNLRYTHTAIDKTNYINLVHLSIQDDVHYDVYRENEKH